MGTAHSALFCTIPGRSEEAVRRFDQCIALDPYHPDIVLHFQGQAHFQLGRYEKAIGFLKRRLIRNPQTDISRVLLAASYGHLSRIEEARTEWKEVFRINPDYSLLHRRNVLPYKNPADFELLMEGLRKTGLVD
jgi:adenylate cyclase